MIEFVRVPKALLEEVLDQAESDSYSTQSEFSCSPADDKRYRAEREKITELRRAAGLEGNSGVIGQGFFGAAIALSEKA